LQVNLVTTSNTQKNPPGRRIHQQRQALAAVGVTTEGGELRIIDIFVNHDNR
jgi:hypothetical protein